ncbi:MAG: hypothetical protein KJN64_05940 [Ignavibacteria bacterium]|nr:hypothetical protein [Ignavibacteria bacterium]MBT8383039.1 hypothetical protein [Ignavibacteria bacterium]MBT8391863.1 hypothetical protein [Ignavibacteria bacterium]NNJ53969.1 hypothetical protein [Ignavibacteriaceae bacterium]NNL21496.1 hypothetical protein [Ignavibacteriaceae bacterium]
MDNFFEILIYVLIIISFLSGLFKKKNKKKRPPLQRPQTQDSVDSEPVAVQTPRKEEYDVLKEIEDFFKVGDEKTEAKPQQTSLPKTEERVSYKEHIDSDQWHQPTASEHKYTDVWKKKEKEVEVKKSKIDSEIEQQAVEFEKHLKRNKSAKREISSKIKERLKKPASLKDYIVIAEIMGKPKAFRR